MVPFILYFSLSHFLLPLGLWRANLAPRYASILLTAGVILFVAGQSSFEVNFPAYIAAVTAWLLSLAPIELRLLL